MEELAFQKIFQLAKLELKTDRDVKEKMFCSLKPNLIGKHNCRKFLIECFQELHPKCSEEQLESARILGWCTDLFQTYSWIYDYVLDRSITRRVQLDWDLPIPFGLTVINDANYLQNFIFIVLEHFFGTSDFYLELVELFLKVSAFVEQNFKISISLILLFPN